MLPVLHEEDVCLVDHQQLHGGEEVKVPLALALGAQQGAQAQRRGDDDVRRVEGRVQTQAPPHDGQTWGAEDGEAGTGAGGQTDRRKYAAIEMPDSMNTQQGRVLYISLSVLMLGHPCRV